jgi:hypothetical protein
VASEPEVIVSSPGCGADYFEINGKAQPALIDPHNAIGELAAAFLRQ